MKEIGEKIREVRKKKGLSQEELDESSKVNLRTIQRIENNKSEPRGKTLHLICEILDIHAEDILDYGKKEDHHYLIILHLSVLAFLVIPVGSIILRLILWMTKKDKITRLKEVGANLLNFQIIWSVFAYISITLFVLFKILHYGPRDILFYIVVILYTVNIILPILFAVRMRNRNTQSGYPKLIKIIR